jgi:hypothetical protein
LCTSLISRSVLRMSCTTRICSSDAFSASAVARTASTHGVPSSVCGDSCVLARRARRLGGHACVLARDPRALSGLSQPLPFLSNGFERVAMTITNRFLRESPELFRLAPGSLRGRAVFRSFTDHVVITAFVHAITCERS